MRVAAAIIGALAAGSVYVAGHGPAAAQDPPAAVPSPSAPASDGKLHPLCRRHAGAQWHWDKLLDCGIVRTAAPPRAAGRQGGEPGHGASFVTGKELEAAMARADLVLIGEVHDNRSQAAGKARLVIARAQAAGRPKPAVLLEHFRADQQVAIDRYLKERGTSWRSHRRAGDRASGRNAVARTLLREVLDWEKSGWPDAALFVPSIEAALSAGLPILAADPPGGAARAVARGGLDVLPAAERARLELDTPLPSPLGASLSDELRAGHCGLLPESVIGNMADAQRYRDAHLAAAMIAAHREHGSAILLAGNGHVRRDRGVPWHLRRQLPKARIVSVMLVEVIEGKTGPGDYVPRDPDGRPAADFVILTSGQPRPDPCEAMRRHMKKKG